MQRIFNSSSRNIVWAVLALLGFVKIFATGLAAPCLTGSSWPRLIGYGKVASEVQSVDRRVQDGALALMLKTAELDLIGGTGGHDNNTLVVTLFDVVSEEYNWLKVILSTVNNGFTKFVYFTPDGTKVLSVFHNQMGTEKKPTFAYLDASSGALITSSEVTSCCPRLESKDGLAFSQSSEKIVFVLSRRVVKTASLSGLQFDGAAFQSIGSRTWKADSQTGDINNQKFSILLSQDDSTVITFTTGEGNASVTAQDCRMDVFAITDLSSILFTKAEHSIQNRRCRFPSIHSQPAPNTIVVVTEYYQQADGIAKAGFMRIELDANFNQVSSQVDQEKIFSGFELKFTSAFFVSSELGFAMAVDLADFVTQLVKFDWNSAGPTLWQLKTFRINLDYAASNTSQYDSLIYMAHTVSPPANNFPVQGYIVGRTRTIFAYNKCTQPSPSYDRLFLSPESSKTVGLVGKIELDIKSCQNENVEPITSVVYSSGVGRDDRNDTMLNYSQNENVTQISVSIMDLFDASASNISLTDLKNMLSDSLAECYKRSSDPLAFYNLVSPVFETDDVIDYSIRTGLYNVEFTNWRVDDDSCTLDFDYQVLESVLGSTTSNLSLVAPTIDNLEVGLQTDDFSLAGVTHTVTVIATNSFYQCEQKDFQVVLHSCLDNTIQLASDYDVLQTSAKGPTVTARAPEVTLSPMPDIFCGELTYSIVWPSVGLTQIQNMLEMPDASSGELSVKSLLESDTGTYNLHVRIELVMFPEVYFETPIQVVIDPCTQESIAPPSQVLQPAYFTIGSATQQIKVEDFVQTPECSPELTYSIVDSSGDPIDSGMKVDLKTDASTQERFITIETDSEDFLGQFKIFVVAESSTGVVNEQDFMLDLTILKAFVMPVAEDPDAQDAQSANTAPFYPESETEGANTLSTVKAADMGILSIQMPQPVDEEGDKVLVAVDLGVADEWLTYDESSNSIYKKDQSKAIPPGNYDVKISLSDDNSEGEAASEWTMQIQVFESMEYRMDGSDEEGLSRTDYPEPTIKSVSALGELRIIWSKPMMLPSNQTFFNEQLLSEVHLNPDQKAVVKEDSLTQTAIKLSVLPNEAQAEPLKFEWEYLKWTNANELVLKLRFQNSLLVSIEDLADVIQVQFFDRTLFKAEDGSYVQFGKTIQKQLPPQIEDNAETSTLGSAASMLSSAIAGVGITSFILSIVISTALNLLWGLLNTLQLLIHLPIFVYFPGFSKIFYDAIIGIAKFEVWETHDTVAGIFELDIDEEPYNERFESFRYDSRNFLMNSGFILLMILFIFALILVSYLLRLASVILCCRAKIRKLAEKLEAILYWGFVIRIVLEVSLELAIISLMDIAVRNWTNWGYITSYALSILSLIILIVFALWIRFYLRKRELKDPAYMKKMGSAYEGLIPRPESLNITEWFIYRRVFYGGAAFFGSGQLWVQFQILFQSSIFTVYQIGTYRPFLELKSLLIEFCNEVFILFIQYHMFTFTELVWDVETKDTMAKSCVGFTSAVILINLTIILVSTIAAVKLRIKRCCARRKALKLLRERQQSQQAQQFQQRIQAYQQTSVLVKTTTASPATSNTRMPQIVLKTQERAKGMRTNLTFPSQQSSMHQAIYRPGQNSQQQLIELRQKVDLQRVFYGSQALPSKEPILLSQSQQRQQQQPVPEQAKPNQPRQAPTFQDLMFGLDLLEMKYSKKQ